MRISLFLALVVGFAAQSAHALYNSDIIDVGSKASRCDWNLISYETIDGLKGEFAHIVGTSEPGKEVVIPLPVKGRYRVWIGGVAQRWAGYCMYVKFARDQYPYRMRVDFAEDKVPAENPMIGELEFAEADLDGDSLVVSNISGSPGGIAWVRLEKIEKFTHAPQRRGKGLIATNDSYAPCYSRSDYFSHFRHFANSPVERILFGVYTGENSFPVKTGMGRPVRYDPTVPYKRDIDIRIAKTCEKLVAENPRLLDETIEYVHSLGIELHAYYRPGTAVDFTRFWKKDSNAENANGKAVLYAPENLCRLWDGTAVGRPSYARKQVRERVAAFSADLIARGFDGICFAFTRALPTMLFEKAFRERFRAEYGEELKSKDDPRVIDLRCKMTGEFLAEIKTILGKKTLSLIVLSSVERNREYGLDIAALAKAGTVDEFIVDGDDFRMPRKITIDKIDFESFTRAVSGTNAKVRPQFTMWWKGLDKANFRKAAEAGFAPACLWDGAYVPWQDWERIRRIDGSDFSAAEKWLEDHPDSWRVHNLKTVNGFDVLEYPWWLAF